MVSASAHADMEFKVITRDPAKAFSWICLCESRFHGEEDEDEDEEKAETGNKVRRSSEHQSIRI